MPDLPLSDEERRLLDAVAADPESDAPRLAYADWIAARDPERAELIRVSIEIARRTPGPDWTDPILTWRRELEAWFARQVGDDPVGFDRGFLRWVTLPADVPSERVAALLEANPLLRSLRLVVDDEIAGSLASLTHLSRLTGLGFSLRKGGAQPDDGRLADLIASPHLTSLKALWFDGVGVGPRTARAIAASHATATLDDLSISGARAFDSAAATALAAGPWSGTLERLVISNCAVRGEGWEALARSRLLAGVTSLELEGSWVGDEGARALAGAPLGKCRKLEMKKAVIGDAGAVALASSPVFEALETLDLTGNHVGNQGAVAFAKTPYFPKLARLLLQYNGIGEQGAEALAGSERLPSLEVLGLDCNAIFTDEIEQWTDWNGTPVGSGPVRVSFWELKARYEGRFKIE